MLAPARSRLQAAGLLCPKLQIAVASPNLQNHTFLAAEFPATWKHGWSKHGFSRIQWKHPQIANSKYIYNKHVLIWWYSAKTMFTPTMFSRRRSFPGKLGHQSSGTASTRESPAYMEACLWRTSHTLPVCLNSLLRISGGTTCRTLLVQHMFLKSHQRGVQWKQGVVVRIIL